VAKENLAGIDHRVAAVKVKVWKVTVPEPFLMNPPAPPMVLGMSRCQFLRS